MSSSLSATRALLDQLMGPNRNKTQDADDSSESRWDDDNVCPWFLCDFCPHDLFKNTKEDLGPCPHLHSPPLKEEFDTQQDKTKNRYYMRYLKFLEGLMSKGDARIVRAKERLELQTPQSFSDPALIRQAKQIQEIESEISSLDKKCESLGEQGKVQEAQETLTKQENLKKQLVLLKEQHKNRGERSEAQVKPLVVCEICGGFIVSDTVSSKRLIAHQAGRMHQGYQMIRNKVKELTESLKGAIIEPDPAPRSRRSGRSGRSRERSRRDRRSRERSRRDRERDRGRRRRGRSRSRDRRH